MKKQGSTSDFTDDRNRELHRHFMDILRTSRGVALRDMFGMAASRPSSRFWVSEHRAAIVVSAMLQGRPLGRINQKRREMYEEITRRVKRLLAHHPDMTLLAACCDVIYQEAPEFYLTDESARCIIYRTRKCRCHLQAI